MSLQVPKSAILPIEYHALDRHILTHQFIIVAEKIMSNTLPPTTPLQTPQPSKKPASFWLSLVLLGLISAMIFGFLQYQKANKPKIETLSRDGVISKIQTLNRLQTVAYHVDTVIQSHKEGSWQKLWTDEQKGLFVAHGRVQAGIDLNQLKPENVQVTPLTPEQLQAKANGDTSIKQTVTITLPPAQVFETYLDNIEVYDIETGLFGAMPTDPAIFSQAQSVGKQQVLATACKSDMLKLATDNAQKQIQSLFSLAALEVTVNTRPPKTCG